MLDKYSESEVHVEVVEERPTSSIAFGLKRIKIDDSLSQLFRSNSKDYKQYEAVTKRFPATEFDVLVVIEGKTLLARDNREKMRDLVTDLQLVEGTRGLISLFSARQAPGPRRRAGAR